MSFFKPTRWNMLFTVLVIIPVFLFVGYFEALCEPIYGSGFPQFVGPNNAPFTDQPPPIIPNNYSRQCGYISDFLTVDISGYVFIGVILLISYVLACTLATFVKRQRLLRFIVIAFLAVLSASFARLWYLSSMTGYSLFQFDPHLLPLFFRIQ